MNLGKWIIHSFAIFDNATVPNVIRKYGVFHVWFLKKQNFTLAFCSFLDNIVWEMAICCGAYIDQEDEFSAKQKI